MFIKLTILLTIITCCAVNKELGMIPFSRKYLVIFLILAASVGGGYASYKGIIYWQKEFLINKWAKKKSDQHKIAEIEDFHTRIDYVRSLVVNNTIHQCDDKFFSYWRDMPRMLEMFFQHSTGESTEILQAECSVRAEFMKKLLEVYGDRVRSVSIYKSPYNSHTFLEIFNQGANRWEIQDPDYDIFWINGRGERASIEDLVSSADLKANYNPCNKGVCSWSVTGKENQNAATLIPYLGLAVRGRDNKVILLNRNRYKSKGGLPGFCNAIPKNCKGSVVIFPKM